MNILGLMSGTSLDGVDLALCTFVNNNNSWSYSITKAQTIPYPEIWKRKLIAAESCSGLELIGIHNEYGKFLGSLINEFLKKNYLKADYISSHGHTIFHQPDIGLTFQIGSGAFIAAETETPTISDFRSLDVALNGQGAPLVPIGDELLFPQFQYCLNLGGIANISYRDNLKRIAYDICPVNIPLNYLAAKMNLEFDKDGALARSGAIDTNLLSQLNSLKYYSQPGPKSLGKEWVKEEFLTILNQHSIPVESLLRTTVEHIAYQVGRIINTTGSKMLITGGGALNSFLIERMRQHCKTEIVIPDMLTINFKEALIFAFLGFLRVNEINNTLCSVTGARKDSTGGCIYWK